MENSAAKGLTLVEVLVIVLILSILAVVIFLAIVGNDDGAERNAQSEAKPSGQLVAEAQMVENHGSSHGLVPELSSWWLG